MTVERQESHSTSPFQEFFRTEAAAGALLVVCACAALVVANSAWADDYHRLWAAPVVIAGGGHALSLTLHQWINDGLMAVFFLLVGLETKREALAGELASPRQAALPIAGAIGGMMVPASIYFLTNGGGMEARGWAIPMATDIAFALGTLALVAPRAPSGLKIFLAALAIVDDVGAVLVIAIFYAGDIAWAALARLSQSRDSRWIDLGGDRGSNCRTSWYSCRRALRPAGKQGITRRNVIALTYQQPRPLTRPVRSL